VLADAGPLYALVDPSDGYHEQSIRELDEFARSRVDIVVAFSTMLEVYSLLMRKLGSGVALKWLREIGRASLINPGPEDYRLAAERLTGFPDQSISLFDSVLAVVAMRTGTHVWTYDHDFDVMRISVWRE
jgi:predicted nucleic acid-binding protein